MVPGDSRIGYEIRINVEGGTVPVPHTFPCNYRTVKNKLSQSHPMRTEKSGDET
jgi:hypothetical protein